MSIVALESDQEYNGGFEVCPRVQQEETHIAQVHQSCAIITTAQVYTRTDFGSIRWLTQPALERQDLSCTCLAYHELESIIINVIIKRCYYCFYFYRFYYYYDYDYCYYYDYYCYYYTTIAQSPR